MQLAPGLKSTYQFPDIMIRAIIIDDEADGRDAIRLSLQKYFPEITTVGIFGNPEDGLNAIKESPPDLLFLDIQMPQMSGFDLLNALMPFSFEVIFVTAFDQYAIKAIRFSALDYLLKPLDIDELRSAIGRAKERLHARDSGHQYQSILHNARQRGSRIERLAVPTGEGIEFFNTADIIYCEADGSYTTLHLCNGPTTLVSRNLKDFENLLGDSGFSRVHHSFLININHVQKYVKGEGGYVVMTGDHHVDISRRRKEDFLRLLDKV